MRVLLLTVFAAALMLTVRLADLWQGLGQMLDAVSVAASQAADVPKAGKPKAGELAQAPAPAQTPPPAAPPAQAAAQSPAQTPAQTQAPAPSPGQTPAAAQTSPGTLGAAPTPNPAPAANATPDAATSATPAQAPASSAAAEPAPAAAGPGAAPVQTDRAKAKAPDDDLYSDAEVATLQELSKRRDELDARDKAIETREGMLAAGQKRVDEKIAELKDLQGKIQGLLKNYNDQEAAKLKSLVKIYENMKPKDAAPIFEQLDMDTLLEIVERMKEAKVAPILANVNPTKAKDITDELARRHEISQAAERGPS
jgi:flagellar motility protein MotE (MotC chaperone)